MKDNYLRSVELERKASLKQDRKLSFKAIAEFDSSKEKILHLDKKHSNYGSTCQTGGKNVNVSDIIGSFGWYQFLVLLFSGLREGSVGYDAVIMPLILVPEEKFLCADKFEPGWKWSNNVSLTQEFNETVQCFQTANNQILLNSRDEPIRCQSWVFPDTNKDASLVTEWSLVCQRHWMVSLVESAYFLGLVSGNLAWGYYADKIGRKKAYLLGHCMSLLFGWACIFMPSIELFTICRYLTAFGSISYNIIYSIQVEIIGTNHRTFSTVLNHMGWGLGVICVPLVDQLFSDYRVIIGVGPLITLIMFPMVFWLPESSRWLMANEDFYAARDELIRAAEFNGRKLDHTMEKNIAALYEKIRFDKMRQEATTDKKSYRLLFSDKTLVRDTLVLAYCSFCGHLFYYMLTINFGYMKNLSSSANFIISGAGEWVSVVVGAILLKMFSRKACMAIFLTLIAFSFTFQALIDSELVPSLDTQLIITLNNAIGTLSALLLIFITLIVNQEVYPTVIRQTGSSIVNTLGESGSTLSPLLIQLGRWAGNWKMDLVYTFACVVGVASMKSLSRTDDSDLQDV